MHCIHLTSIYWARFPGQTFRVAGGGDSSKKIWANLIQSYELQSVDLGRAGGGRRLLQPIEGALAPSARPPDPAARRILGCSPASPRPSRHVTPPRNPRCQASAELKVVAGGRRECNPRGSPGDECGRPGEVDATSSRSGRFPVLSPPFVARVPWSLCMRSLAWAGHGDHVAGTPEEARVPGTSSARTARSSSISSRVSAAARGALLGTPASRGGLARSAADSRRVSRESKLKEHGDV